MGSEREEGTYMYFHVLSILYNYVLQGHFTVTGLFVWLEWKPNKHKGETEMEKQVQF